MSVTFETGCVTDTFINYSADELISVAEKVLRTDGQAASAALYAPIAGCLLRTAFLQKQAAIELGSDSDQAAYQAAWDRIDVLAAESGIADTY